MPGTASIDYLFSGSDDGWVVVSGGLDPCTSALFGNTRSFGPSFNMATVTWATLGIPSTQVIRTMRVSCEWRVGADASGWGSGASDWVALPADFRFRITINNAVSGTQTVSSSGAADCNGISWSSWFASGTLSAPVCWLYSDHGGVINPTAGQDTLPFIVEHVPNSGQTGPAGIRSVHIEFDYTDPLSVSPAAPTVVPSGSVTLTSSVAVNGWSIISGGGTLSGATSTSVVYTAPGSTGSAVVQASTDCEVANTTITIASGTPIETRAQGVGLARAMLKSAVAARSFGLGLARTLLTSKGSVRSQGIGLARAQASNSTPPVDIIGGDGRVGLMPIEFELSGPLVVGADVAFELYFCGLANASAVASAAYGTPTYFVFDNPVANTDYHQTQTPVDLNGAAPGTQLFLRLRRIGNDPLDTSDANCLWTTLVLEYDGSETTS